MMGMKATEKMPWRALYLAAFSTFAFINPVTATSLPGGAGSLVETYQDWAITCQPQGGGTACVLRQVQNDTRTGQHILTAEFRLGPRGKVEGALLMPFGFALAKGLKLSMDAADGPTIAFATCRPDGCLAPVVFGASVVKNLRTGTTLTASGTASVTNEVVTFTVSLKGFSAALTRLAELTR